MPARKTGRPGPRAASVAEEVVSLAIEAMQSTVTPKILSILTSTVVHAVHHQTPWESRLALVELNVEDTLGYKNAPWVM